MLKVKVYPDGFTTLVREGDHGVRGYISLGRDDNAKAIASEAALVLDSFVRPWVTDGTLPERDRDVEILILPPHVVRGYYCKALGWLAFVREDCTASISPDQFAGWREMVYYKAP